MKTILVSLVALAALAGAVNAAPASQGQADAVVGYGCGSGH